MGVWQVNIHNFGHVRMELGKKKSKFLFYFNEVCVLVMINNYCGRSFGWVLLQSVDLIEF